MVRRSRPLHHPSAHTFPLRTHSTPTCPPATLLPVFLPPPWTSWTKAIPYAHLPTCPLRPSPTPSHPTVDAGELKQEVEELKAPTNIGKNRTAVHVTVLVALRLSTGDGALWGAA